MNSYKERVLYVINSVKKMETMADFHIFDVSQMLPKVSFKVNERPTKEQISQINKYNLPADYLQFLSQCNGMSLFDDGLGIPRCTINSIDEVLKYRKMFYDAGFTDNWENRFPIASVRDCGMLEIEVDKFVAGEPYLRYPDESGLYFKLDFITWLENYLMSCGNEFWYFSNPL